MSTSFSPVLEPGAKSAAQPPEVRPFSYLPVSGAVAGAGPLPAAAQPIGQDQKEGEEVLRRQARAEGEAAARAAYEQNLAQVREQLRATLDDFTRQRTAYYRRVEEEVVRLALAIARKVLYREAQIDPLLLAGMVRVALDQIEAHTKVVVRVHPQQFHDARAYLMRSVDPASAPDVVEDPAVPRDCCVLQTELGTTELGLEPQFKEIEQGLLDLLAKRPSAER